MDKSKIYIDLSKCTEEQRKYIISLLPERKEHLQYRIDQYNTLLYLDNETGLWWVNGDTLPKDKTELTYPEFIKLFEGGESKEVLKVENNGWIKSIAISHQKQMSSTHPHAIIGTIEDAIIEALETFKSNN